MEHFRNGECGDIAKDIALSHLACNHAGEVAALIEAGIVVAKILTGLIAGGMHEHDLWKILRNFFDIIHVAKACCKDDLVTAGGHLANYPLCVRTLGDLLDKRGGDFSCH